MAVNKVILIGNLGADPDVRYAQDGKAVVNMRLATSEKWTGRDGQAQEKTEWHRLVAFGKTAELCRDYLAKGRQIYVEGRLQTREWQDKDGNKRYTTEVVISVVRFLGGKPGASQAPGQDRQAAQAETDFSSPPPIEDDDVPF